MCSIWFINTNVITVLRGHSEASSSPTRAANCTNDTDAHMCINIHRDTYMHTNVSSMCTVPHTAGQHMVAHVCSYPSVQTVIFQAAGGGDICFRTSLTGLSQWLCYRGLITPSTSLTPPPPSSALIQDSKLL